MNHREDMPEAVEEPITVGIMPAMKDFFDFYDLKFCLFFEMVFCSLKAPQPEYRLRGFHYNYVPVFFRHFVTR